MKHLFTPNRVLSLLLCGALLTGCAAQEPEKMPAPTQSAQEQQDEQPAPSARPVPSVAPAVTHTDVTVPEFVPASALTADAAVFSKEDRNADWSAASAKEIVLNGSSVSITEEGTYVLSGELKDGSISIETKKDQVVRLILNGVSIHSSDSAAIAATKGKLIVTLADGTENILTSDAKSAGDDEPSAALYSKDDLTINGGGALSVTSFALDGITSRDTLRIAGGTLSVKAGDDGIVGRDAFLMENGTLTIEAKGDGIKASNDSDADKGFIVLTGGTLSVVSGNDGIQAETAALLCGGKVSVTAGGGRAASTSEEGEESDNESGSAKAVKAGQHLLISGGSYALDAREDALHSNGTALLSDGELTLCAGGDGVHADAVLQFAGSQTDITDCYEGMEGTSILITGGSLNLTARDDGINVAGVDTETETQGFASMNGTAGDSLYITGGFICVNAEGDGIDVNGSGYMTGGLVLVNGPSTGDNGALDYDEEFNVYGGTLIAAGAPGMAQAPSGGEQPSILMNFPSTLPADTIIHLENAAGETVVTYAPAKAFGNAVITAPGLSVGSEYTLFTGGSCDGTSISGWYEGCTYTPGEEVVSFPLDSVITYASESGVGSSGFGHGGFGGQPPQGGFGGRHPDGQRPGMPEGFDPNGERPELPEGFDPNGERPELPEGFDPNGERPQLPEGFAPNGERPEPPEGFDPNVQPPALPENGAQPTEPTVSSSPKV